MGTHWLNGVLTKTDSGEYPVQRGLGANNDLHREDFLASMWPPLPRGRLQEEAAVSTKHRQQTLEKLQVNTTWTAHKPNDQRAQIGLVCTLADRTNCEEDARLLCQARIPPVETSTDPHVTHAHPPNRGKLFASVAAAGTVRGDGRKRFGIDDSTTYHQPGTGPHRRRTTTQEQHHQLDGTTPMRDIQLDNQFNNRPTYDLTTQGIISEGDGLTNEEKDTKDFWICNRCHGLQARSLLFNEHQRRLNPKHERLHMRSCPWCLQYYTMNMKFGASEHCVNSHYQTKAEAGDVGTTEALRKDDSSLSNDASWRCSDCGEENNVAARLRLIRMGRAFGNATLEMNRSCQSCGTPSPGLEQSIASLLAHDRRRESTAEQLREIGVLRLCIRKSTQGLTNELTAAAAKYLEPKPQATEATHDGAGQARGNHGDNEGAGVGNCFSRIVSLTKHQWELRQLTVNRQFDKPNLQEGQFGLSARSEMYQLYGYTWVRDCCPKRCRGNKCVTIGQYMNDSEAVPHPGRVQSSAPREQRKIPHLQQSGRYSLESGSPFPYLQPRGRTKSEQVANREVHRPTRGSGRFVRTKAPLPPAVRPALNQLPIFERNAVNKMYTTTFETDARTKYLTPWLDTATTISRPWTPLRERVKLTLERTAKNDTRRAAFNKLRDHCIHQASEDERSIIDAIAFENNKWLERMHLRFVKGECSKDVGFWPKIKTAYQDTTVYGGTAGLTRGRIHDRDCECQTHERAAHDHTSTSYCRTFNLVGYNNVGVHHDSSRQIKHCMPCNWNDSGPPSLGKRHSWMPFRMLRQIASLGKRHSTKQRPAWKHSADLNGNMIWQPPEQTGEHSDHQFSEERFKESGGRTMNIENHCEGCIIPSEETTHACDSEEDEANYDSGGFMPVSSSSDAETESSDAETDAETDQTEEFFTQQEIELYRTKQKCCLHGELRDRCHCIDCFCMRRDPFQAAMSAREIRLHQITFTEYSTCKRGPHETCECVKCTMDNLECHDQHDHERMLRQIGATGATKTESKVCDPRHTACSKLWDIQSKRKPENVARWAEQERKEGHNPDPHRVPEASSTSTCQQCQYSSTEDLEALEKEADDHNFRQRMFDNGPGPQGAEGSPHEQTSDEQRSQLNKTFERRKAEECLKYTNYECTGMKLVRDNRGGWATNPDYRDYKGAQATLNLTVHQPLWTSRWKPYIGDKGPDGQEIDFDAATRKYRNDRQLKRLPTSVSVSKLLELSQRYLNHRETGRFAATCASWAYSVETRRTKPTERTRVVATGQRLIPKKHQLVKVTIPTLDTYSETRRDIGYPEIMGYTYQHITRSGRALEVRSEQDLFDLLNGENGVEGSNLSNITFNAFKTGFEGPVRQDELHPASTVSGGYAYASKPKCQKRSRCINRSHQTCDQGIGNPQERTPGDQLWPRRHVRTNHHSRKRPPTIRNDFPEDTPSNQTKLEWNAPNWENSARILQCRDMTCDRVQQTGGMLKPCGRVQGQSRDRWASCQCPRCNESTAAMRKLWCLRCERFHTKPQHQSPQHLLCVEREEALRPQRNAKNAAATAARAAASAAQRAAMRAQRYAKPNAHTVSESDQECDDWVMVTDQDALICAWACRDPSLNERAPQYPQKERRSRSQGTGVRYHFEYAYQPSGGVVRLEQSPTVNTNRFYSPERAERMNHFPQGFGKSWNRGISTDLPQEASLFLRFHDVPSGMHDSRLNGSVHDTRSLGRSEAEPGDSCPGTVDAVWLETKNRLDARYGPRQRSGSEAGGSRKRRQEHWKTAWAVTHAYGPPLRAHGRSPSDNEAILSKHRTRGVVLHRPR